MKTYQLNTYSDIRHNGTIFVGMIVAMSCAGIAMVNKQSSPVCFGILLGMMILVKLLANRFYKATANFSITDSGLAVEWANGFAIFAEPNYNFRFDDLAAYVFEPWGEIYRLKISTKQGKTIKFLFKKAKGDTSSFTSFFETLQSSINSFNNIDTNNTNDIMIGKTFWESKTAKVIAVALAIIIVGAWTKVLSGEITEAKMPKLFIVSLAGLLYIGRILFASYSINDRT